MNWLELIATPAECSPRRMYPEGAPAGTFTVNDVAVGVPTILPGVPVLVMPPAGILSFVSPKITTSITERSVPVMVTNVPAGPEDGVNPVIVGPV